MKIVTVIGARPQFIKASMISRVLQGCAEEIIVHTGQHYDDQMSAIFFKQLELPTPKYHLGIGSDTHGKQTGRMIEAIESVLYIEQPQLLLVYGDTNSTLAASLAASKLGIPIAHVESGLRSFNKKMPEEINRVITDHLSTLLLCPTEESLKNLKREGIRHQVHLVGDVMYDSVLQYKQIAAQHSDILAKLNLSPTGYYLSTIHRAESTDNPALLSHLLETLGQLDHKVVLPMHPRTEKLIRQWQLEEHLSASNLIIVKPLSYLDMLHLEHNAKLILTDSGGVQKEAYMLEVPCITLRNETEWVETVTAGWNQVSGINKARIFQLISELKIPSDCPQIFGDGKASEKICQILVSFK